MPQDWAIIMYFVWHRPPAFGSYASLQAYDGVQFRDVAKLNEKGETIFCNVNCLLDRKNGELVAGTSTDGLLS